MCLQTKLPRNNGEGVCRSLGLHPADGTVRALRVLALRLLAVPPRHAVVPPRALRTPALKVARALQLLAAPPRAPRVPAPEVARGL